MAVAEENPLNTDHDRAFALIFPVPLPAMVSVVPSTYALMLPLFRASAFQDSAAVPLGV